MAISQTEPVAQNQTLPVEQTYEPPNIHNEPQFVTSTPTPNFNLADTYIPPSLQIA